jgi:hypothetical protein
VQHLQKAGFPTKVLETKDLDAVKTRLGVPDDLAACHTAEDAVRSLITSPSAKAVVERLDRALGLPCASDALRAAEAKASHQVDLAIV